MATANMSIRMDSEVKSQAQMIFSQFGLDMTTAINMFLRQAIRERGIPFDLHLGGSLEQAMRDIEEGRVYGPYATVKEAMASMLEGDDDA